MTGEFKRMLVGLPQCGMDVAAVSVTAQLAELLGLSLAATFVEDGGLVSLAALPCAREYRPLGGGWHPIEVRQLAVQLEHAETVARRLFHQAVQSSRIDVRFDVLKGSFADTIGSMATADDIIVIIEPRNPAERVTHQFNQFLDVAFRAAAAVMIVPSQITRTAGPIASVASDQDDPSIRCALAIAAAMRERAIVLGALRSDARATIGAMAEAAGVKFDIRAPIQIGPKASDLIASLAGLKERLIVVSRGMVADEAVSMIATLRGIPVLLIEPQRTIGVAIAPGS